MIYPTPDLDLPPDHLLRQLIDAIAATLKCGSRYYACYSRRTFSPCRAR